MPCTRRSGMSPAGSNGFCRRKASAFRCSRVRCPPISGRRGTNARLREGMQVCVAHPRLVSVGMDLLWAPSIYFVQTGYSIYTLRQASRRSWRIGQRSNVVVRFLTYNDTMQTSCLRLMGKKLLVSLAMEGKFSNEGLQGIEDDDDVLTAMARELVTEKGVGESAASVWKAVQEQHSRLLPAFTCLRRGVRRGFCRFASQRTGYLRDNPEGSDLWDPARKRDDAEETADRRIGLSTLAVLNRQTREHAHREFTPA